MLILQTLILGPAHGHTIAYAIERDADLVVKIDADGQMDPRFIPVIRRVFAQAPAIACVKGNRFFDARVLRLMVDVAEDLQQS